MGRTATRPVYREETDYSQLLAELQQERTRTIDRLETVSETVSEDAGQDDDSGKFRHRLASDENIRFFYSDEGIIHDKTCDRVKEICDDELKYSYDYLAHMKPCSHCAARAYLRVGAKDYEEHENYEKLFRHMQVPLYILRSMYVEHHMKTRLNGNTITIWYKEDRWQIEALDKQGGVQLRHNNYRKLADGKREFVPGFHIQNDYCHRTNIKYAYTLIRKYDYMGHFATASPEAVNVGEEVCFRENGSLWHRIKLWFTDKFKAYSEKNKELVIREADFTSTAGGTYPKDKTRCLYIWGSRDEKRHFQAGVYSAEKKAFLVQYGEVIVRIRREKVLKWREMEK